jgi:hypothetical protein
MGEAKFINKEEGRNENGVNLPVFLHLFYIFYKYFEIM